MLINHLIGKLVEKRKTEYDDTLKTLEHTGQSFLVADLTEYLQWVLDNPQDFADSQKTPRRELYTPKQLIEAFNEAMDHDTISYLYIKRLLPDERFVAKNKTVSFKRLTGKNEVRKLVAIKNHLMWHNATSEEAIKHLLDTAS